MQQSKEYNDAAKMFLITTLFGWLGIHKYIKKKYIIGVIYTLTFGLYFVGWAIDIIICIIDMFRKYEKNTLKKDSANILPSVDPESNTNLKKNHFCFSKIEDGYILKYEYQKNIAGVEYRDLDFSNLINGYIEFKLEPDNEYDKKAIAIYQKNVLLGYVYKSDDMINEMIHKYINNDEWKVFGWLCTLDSNEKILSYQIAFYKKINEDEAIKIINTTLIKTTKKDEINGLTRQDNLNCMDENDILQLDTQFDSDCLIVLNESYEELGELSEKVSNEMNNFINNDEYMILAKITEMTENDSGKMGAKIKILIFNN